MSHKQRRELGLKIDRHAKELIICDDISMLLSSAMQIIGVTRKRCHSLYNLYDTTAGQPSVIRDLDTILYDLKSIKQEIDETAFEAGEDKAEAEQLKAELDAQNKALDEARKG